MRKEQRLINFRKMSRDANGKIKDAVDDLVGVLIYWAQSEFVAPVTIEVQGDGVATGTELCVLSIPAGKTFVCCIAKCSSNIAAMVNIGHGTLVPAAMVDLDFIDIQNVGMGGVISDGFSPSFVWKNTTAAAVEIVMYAPQSAKGVATNNDINHWFHGFIGGLII